MDFTCTKCSSPNVTVKSKGKRIGMYCRDCGAWIKWLTYIEMLKVYRHLDSSNQLPEKTAYKKIGTFKESINMRCSHCGCPLYNSAVQTPKGQLDLSEANFCPQCGYEFI